MGTGKFYGTPREHTACVHRIPRSGKTCRAPFRALPNAAHAAPMRPVEESALLRRLAQARWPGAPVRSDAFYGH
jgi:hypothetical protein